MSQTVITDAVVKRAARLIGDITGLFSEEPPTIESCLAIQLAGAVIFDLTAAKIRHALSPAELAINEPSLQLARTRMVANLWPKLFPTQGGER